MNVGTSVNYTYENAPRSVPELSLIGRFRLKDLAMSIGLGETPELRSGLTNQTVPELATAVAQKLAQMDAAAGGGAQAPAAPPVAAPVAPAAAPPAAKRSPRNSAAAAATPAPATPIAGGSPEVMAALASLAASQDILQKQLADNAAAVANLGAQLNEIAFRQDVATSLSLFFAEEHLGGSRPSILEQALTDVPDVNALLGKARQGK